MMEPKKSSMPIIELLPPELRDVLPPLTSQEGISDPTVYAKFLSRDPRWVWYVTEGSPDDDDFLFFGFVVGPEKEWGYFSLSELTEARPPWECPIERDLYFNPERLSRAITGEVPESSVGRHDPELLFDGNAGLESMKRNGPTQKINKPSMKSKLTIAGLLIGSVVGFLLRPSVPLMGQLPFTTVITRGANLRGLDQLLLGYARTSFNYLIAGMVLGAIIGLIAAFVIPCPKS